MKNISTKQDLIFEDAFMGEDEGLTITDILRGLQDVHDETPVMVRKGEEGIPVTGITQHLGMPGIVLAYPGAQQERYVSLGDIRAFADVVSGDPDYYPAGEFYVQIHDDEYSVDAVATVTYQGQRYVCLYVDCGLETYEALRHIIDDLRATEEAQQVKDENTQLHSDINDFLRSYN